MIDALLVESYRRKADDLLRQAAAANMAERGRPTDEAASWHLKAVAVAGGGGQPEAEPIAPDLGDESEEPRV
ncbi:MAG: hypothetical protein Q8Q88_11765 [Phenylobacterium sp.]|uniref:hypothetical protein n=1 Tax=Phenylobacterium sp. TaxID=1871053 RepID=UPI0027339AD3|nr:hypothetical protein [Phenylobacterium sp.]MDP3747711.1 hypothetical protein [Phenylobacterium sp.]